MVAAETSRGERLPGTPEPDLFIDVAEDLRVAADQFDPPPDVTPTGETVLLLHGGGQTRHAWKGAGEALAAAGYRALSLDARGHGDSDWAPDGDYTVDAMVADLVAVITALDARPILVGASMGGGISLTAVGEGTIEARALVLVDTAPRVEAAGVQRIRDFMRQAPDGFASLEEVADAISTYQPHRPRPRSFEGLAKNVRLWPDGRYRWHWDPAFMQRPRGTLEERIARQERAATGLTLPTLLVRGGLSDVLSAEGAQAFLEVVPHAQYANVTDAAHMVAGDRNDVFLDAVQDFLATLPAGD